MYILFRKCNFCEKKGRPPWLFTWLQNLPASQQKFWSYEKLSAWLGMLFKKEQTKYLHLRVLPWGSLLHFADPCLILPSGLTAVLIWKAGWNVWSCTCCSFPFSEGQWPWLFSWQPGGSCRPTSFINHTAGQNLPRWVLAALGVGQWKVSRRN